MRLILLLLLFTTNISLFSQEKKWYVTDVEADELLGSEAKTVYQYIESGVGNILYSEKDKIFMLTTQKGIFDYKANSTSIGVNRTVKVLMGFYDENNNLIKKKTINYHVTDDGQSCYTRWIGEIIPFLKNSDNEGSHVRLVASLYGNGIFDITIPIFSEQIKIE